MTARNHRRNLFAGLLVGAALLASALPAAAADPPPGWSATPLTVASRVEGFKSANASLVKSDPALLARTDAAPVNVMIKLDYDATASYAGGIAGLDATSPRVTGKKLTGKSKAELAYSAYAKRLETAAIAAIRKAAPTAKLGHSFRTVYGGISVRLPANTVRSLLRIDGIVAVQSDAMRQPLTDASSDFIDATAVQTALGGRPNAGKGVIFGSLDSGVWPEHPSFADNGNLGAPPPKANGTPRTCDFGDNPLTPATDVFQCNNKLIGGKAFLAGYLSNPARAAAEPYKTARDSNGHGTHTASTAAGDVVASAPVFGVQRGPINGIAPGAWVSVYKVCGIQGCVSSDSAAAVAQAIVDGVNVINFSISGGTDPSTDPVELAFLDAYAAGVFVSTSAGNDGPGAGTANHVSPWVTSVAASTQTREFVSHLTVSGGGATAEFDGASITAGISSPLPVVLASAAPYNNLLCSAPAAAGTFTGKIVVCARGGGIARVDKGYNVFQGGAAGMILYNPTLADVETDNHWLPTVHLADGTDFLAFLTAHPGATATFTAGTKQSGQGDVMAAFSSRGPAGLVIKPDITAPGVQILGGMTPVPESVTEGPPGQYFQAIAGTSMSSPHAAGSAILIKALHPDWDPGSVKSALMTTAKTSVVKEDLTTPADPFDFGSGRIDVAHAAAAPLTFDESAADFAALGLSPLTAIHLNIPSIDAPVMPGKISTERVVKNVTSHPIQVRATATATGGKVSVSPGNKTILPGKSQTYEITIRSDAEDGVQQFGQVNLAVQGGPTLHLPVAYVHHQGAVSLAASCTPTTIKVNATTDCGVTATNLSFEDQTVDLTTEASSNMKILSATGATVTNNGRYAKAGPVTLSGAEPGVPSITPGDSVAGYLPLNLFGTPATPIGDEQILNFSVPGFVYNGVTYTSVGVDSNGYVIAGGGTSTDNECCNLPTGADPAPPNNMLAAFWTDLDGTGAPGIFADVLTDGVDSWIVIEYQVNVFGTTQLHPFQIWIGVNGTQDISYAYDPANLPTDPNGQPFLVGAENQIGGGEMNATLPAGDQVITSTPPTPGASAHYDLTVRGLSKGTGTLTTTMKASGVLGRTITKTKIAIEK